MNSPKVLGLQADTCGQILQLLKKAYRPIYEAYLVSQSIEDSEELKTDVEDAFHYLISGIETLDPRFFVDFKDHEL